jgi:hypothetical protein
VNRGITTVFACAFVIGCSHAQHAAATQPAAAVVAPKQVKLAILPAESDAFPKAALAASESLAQAHVSGVDETIQSKVSLEVVQLSIECVQATAACYEAVGKTLSADRLLFAQISSPKKKQIKVTVTLFDVPAENALGFVEKTFASEQEAAAGIAALVTEATGGERTASAGRP